MLARPEHIRGQTVHARQGKIGHKFRYSVDYVLINPESSETPLLFSRKGANLATVHDRNHGGTRGAGRGSAWFREVLADKGLPAARITQVLLLTQPGFLGAVFNPVSFWLAYEEDDLIAVIAEVNNTFGDRHCYLCAHPGFTPIAPSQTLESEKLMHVSPFREVSGTYRFRFSITQEHVAILIDHKDGSEGLHATLTGPRAPMTSAGLFHAALVRRPLGALRTLILIYWQAIVLRSKGAIYRRRPAPPSKELS